MKTTSISIPALSLLAALAVPLPLGAQTLPRYFVTDLGPAGNPFAQATFLNNSGLVAGLDTASDGTSHAIFWYGDMLQDISKPGLGGPNSSAGGANEFGQIVGGAETSVKDPNNENFCAYGTGLQCLPFVWQYGVMTALPTLKGADGKYGTNAGFGLINNLGQIAGYAENSDKDPECPGSAAKPTAAVNGTGPQVLDFEAVIWGPGAGQIQQLPPLPGDTVAMALGINDLGEAVGTSGTCANTVLPGFAVGPHAVLWDSTGAVHFLGSLGGSANTQMLGVGSVAFVINNSSQVTGQAVLSGNETFHPFLWTQEKGMRDLGVLPGDLVGAGLGMNNKGVIVGASVSAPGPATGNPRAFVWQDGVMSDLNALVQQDAPLYLLNAFSINDSGDIVGFGATSDGELHGFLAMPNERAGGRRDVVAAPAAAAAKPILSEDARKWVLQHLRFGGVGTGPNR
jgi:probable HAF family extracellular repeat protein